jgi:uncharacterized protein
MQIRKLGLIADTHGVLLEDAIHAFRVAQIDMILHAGDIGGAHVLEQLETLAPVVAVAGNGDEPMFHQLPWDLRLTLGNRRVFLCHWYDNYGRIHPEYRRVVQQWEPDILVYGHTHQAVIERQEQTLFLNPGYGGPPEPSRERSVATVDLATLDARIIRL